MVGLITSVNKGQNVCDLCVLLSSLKQTSLVLADHEDALKKKLQHNLEKLEHDRYDNSPVDLCLPIFNRVEQTSALAKYRIIWERYETFYDSMKQVHEAKQKKEELEYLKEQSENTRAVYFTW